MKCNATFTIPSSSRITSTGKKFWTVNVGAVLGQMATGGGASRLQQVMGSVGVASVSKQTFTATEKFITEEVERQLSQTMLDAGKEEQKYAESSGEYFQRVPAITVIADEGWSKRSHKHSYNAKSGVAVIIGMHTNKLLFLGVRNKYCSTCSIAKTSGIEIPKHVCFLNWNGSLPAMETDIVVEGLRQAESTHGVQYMRLVGDGNSSVLTSIQCGVDLLGKLSV